MSTPKRLLLVVAVALAALSAGAGAGAATLQFEPAGEVTLDSLGRITFDSTWDIACDYTLNGVLTSAPFTATRGTQFGEITEGEVENCTGGTAVILNETLPWEITYAAHSAEGGVQMSISDFTFLLTVFGSGCHWSGDLGGTLEWTRAGESTYTSDLLVGSGSTVTLVRRLSGLFNCPANGSMVGTFELAPQQTITES